MRTCALWISPHVKPTEEVILDTAVPIDYAAAVQFARNGPDLPPKDMVLVVMHPARHHRLVKAIATIEGPEAFARLGDVNGSGAAKMIIQQRCRQDPDLARRLRW